MKSEVRLSYAHRLLSCRPVCLLTTQYRGQANVMTLAWTSSLGLEPPLVGMAIHPSRYTHDMLCRSEEFVLNIPARPLLEQVQQCGELSGADDDKIELCSLTLDSPKRVEPPWIQECIAHIEGTVVEILHPGDHTLFVGEIAGAWAEEEAFVDQWIVPQESEELAPLVHLGGQQFALLGQGVTYS